MSDDISKYDTDAYENGDWRDAASDPANEPEVVIPVAKDLNIIKETTVQDFDATNDSMADLSGNTDGYEWACKFVKVVPQCDLTVAIAWFANAIEVGRMSGYKARLEESVLKTASDESVMRGLVAESLEKARLEESVFKMVSNVRDIEAEENIMVTGLSRLFDKFCDAGFSRKEALRLVRDVAFS